MAFFYSFTDSLRQKWLNFYQANRDWISLHMQVESVYTPDGGKRPPSYLILGVANALEPKLAQLMLPFSKLNADADTLIEVLDLHFDPEMLLGNRIIPSVETEGVETEDIDGDTSAIAMGSESIQPESIQTEGEFRGQAGDDFDREIMVAKEFLSSGSSREMSGEMSVDGVPQTEEVMGEQAAFGETVPHEYPQEDYQSQPFASAESLGEFGDISFDAKTEILGNQNEETLENFDLDDDSQPFSDVVRDVWGEESSVRDGEINNEAQLGEERSEDAFDDTEIARLFPDT